MLEGHFGKLEKFRTVKSQSRRMITLEESSQSSGSNSWKRNFTFDIAQTIEFVGGGCDGGQRYCIIFVDNIRGIEIL